MAEMLTYAPDLRSITGGQGEYTMEFLRYEEVPATSRRRSSRRRRRGRGNAASQPNRPSRETRCGWARSRCYPRRHAVDPRHPHEPGRHLLRRMRPHAAARRAARSTFLAGGSRRQVCELCTVRAAARGLDPRGRCRRADAPRGAQRAPAARRLLGAPALAPRRDARTLAAEEARGRAADRPDRRRALAERYVETRAPPAAARGAARRAAARAAPRARGADQRRAQDAARARGLQCLRAPAHGRRRRALARGARVCVRPLADRRQRRLDRGRCGSCAGTATRSTSPRRPLGVRRAAQGDELTELPPEDQVVQRRRPTSAARLALAARPA